jgi:hypothetical protein
MSDNSRDCSVCHGSHEDDSEALTCVGEAWMRQNMEIKILKEQLAESFKLTNKAILLLNKMLSTIQQ